MPFDLSQPAPGESDVRLGPLRALRWQAQELQAPQTLLAVHGMWVGAPVWRALGPYLAAQGYTTYAVWLRHHHPDDDRAQLHGLGLADYAADVVEAAQALDGPVLVGHSMGGLVAQLAAAAGAPAGLALLASAPPFGIPPIPRLSFLPAAARQMVGRPFERRPVDVFAPQVFMERLDERQRQTLGARAAPEPRRAARQLALWPPRVRRAHVRCPVFVGGGDLDPVIIPWVTRRLAARYRVVAAMYEDRGHMLLLEDGWRAVADDLMLWADRYVE